MNFSWLYEHSLGYVFYVYPIDSDMQQFCNFSNSLYPVIVKYKVFKFLGGKLCQLSNYCISYPNSLFIACSVKMDMGPLNIVPLSVGTHLALTVEGAGEALQEEEFCFGSRSSYSPQPVPALLYCEGRKLDIH